MAEPGGISQYRRRKIESTPGSVGYSLESARKSFMRADVRRGLDTMFPEDKSSFRIAEMVSATRDSSDLMRAE